MPSLPTQTLKTDSIQLSSASGNHDAHEELYVSGGKWEDEEERKFFEDLQDLRDFVPKSLLGLDEKGEKATGDEDGNTSESAQAEKEREKLEREREEEDVRKIEEELRKLKIREEKGGVEDENVHHVPNGIVVDDEDEYVSYLHSMFDALMVLLVRSACRPLFLLRLRRRRLLAHRLWHLKALHKY